MPKFKKLTKTLIDSLAPESKPVLYWDNSLPGFYLQVSPKGRRAFYIYTRVDGRQQRMKIGNYPPMPLEAAKIEAKRLLADASQGKQIADAKREAKGRKTFNDFIEQYLEDYARPRKKAKTVLDEKSNLDLHIKPAIGKKNLKDIRRADIAKLHAHLKATPYQANRVLALLKTMFNLAESWGERDEGPNPCRGIARYKETSRKRYLAPDEFKRLAGAITAAETGCLISPSAAAGIRLLLLTGCRRNEILNLRWEHIDIVGGTIELPDSKTGQKTVYLNDGAIEVLGSLNPQSSGWVLPSPIRKGHPLVNISKPWGEVLKLAGLQNLRLHDCRHAFASVAAGLNLGLPIIGELLGHTQAATTARYAHLYDDPLRAAAQSIGAEISRAMNGQTAEVVDVPTKRKESKPDRVKRSGS